MNIFLKLMLALVFSAALSFFLLRGWRDEMAGEMADAAERRRTEKERLRSALAGDDQPAADRTDRRPTPRYGPATTGGAAADHPASRAPGRRAQAAARRAGGSTSWSSRRPCGQGFAPGLDQVRDAAASRRRRRRWR